MSETSVELGIKPTARGRFDRLLRPRSIAVVGVSSNPGSLGECVITNLDEAGYSGDLYLVNPKRPMIHGRQCFGSIEELPEGIDCAVLAVPSTAVIAAARACALKGMGSAIVFSSGFAEAGDEGRASQAELRDLAREYGMALEGPNCLGMVNYTDGIPLTFVLTPPQQSSSSSGAAIISQSGALAAVIGVNMRHHRIPLTYSVSTGNEADCGVEDFIEQFIAEPGTRVLALVVEQFKQPKRFLELTRRAREADQFVVLLHPGRSDAARVSAATHTGAIAGDYEVMRTLVAHAGVIQVGSLEELVDVTQILVRCGELPRGGSAIFTESGAFKALALDLCAETGLPLPAISAPTATALRQVLPAFIPATNPLDVTAQGLVDPTLYRRTLKPILDDDCFGSVLVGIILTDAKTTHRKLPQIVDAVRTLKPRKPVVFAGLDEGAPFEFGELEELRSLGVACFPSAERAVRALAHVARFVSRRCDHDLGFLIDQSIPLVRKGVLPEWESKFILEQVGIAIPRGRLARNVDEALAIGAEIGFPIALKAQSPDLPHKSDAGGVVLGVQTEEQLVQGWSELHRRVQTARPDAALDGVLVERMGEPGLELIVGGKNDPQWGPVLLVGAGGVLAEVMGDVRLLPPDLSREAIEEELKQLRCGALLKGFRGAPALDVAAVTDVISQVGRLMLSASEIVEIDINPLIVYAKGKGAVALDALISVGREI